MRLFILCLVIMLSLLSLAGAGWCMTYDVHLLTSDGYTSAGARAIDNSGRIIGWGNVPDVPTPSSALVWNSSSGNPLVIPMEYGTDGTPVANNSGQVAGLMSEINYSHMYTWSKGTGTIDFGRLDGQVYGINDSGQIVGWAMTERPDPITRPFTYAFLWDQANGFTKLAGFENYFFSTANDINNAGEEIGTAAQSSDGPGFAYFWSPKTGVTNLGSNVSPVAMNDSGQVIGYTFSAPGIYDTFIWQSGQGMTTIALPSGYDWLELGAMNNNGVVVGSIGGDDNISHAFSWSASTGFTVLGAGEAYGINDSGQIVGQMLMGQDADNNDVYNAAIWQPVPEPSGLIVLLCGIGGLGGLMFRRRAA